MTSFGPERLTGSAPSVGIAPFSWSPWKAYGFLIVTSDPATFPQDFHHSTVRKRPPDSGDLYMIEADRQNQPV
jgi:hypothetical protein